MNLLGWCFIHSFLLHFILILTNKKRLLSRWWAYSFMYAPSIVLLWRSLTGILIAKEFYMTPWGNAEIIATESIWFNLYGLYNILFLFIGCGILLHWGITTKVQRHKKQAKIIIITTVSSFLMASFCNMVIPELGIEFPSIGAVFGIPIIIGSWWAMSRYKFLILTPEIAAGEIISKMMDIMILSDQIGSIITVNRQAEELLGHSSGEFIKKSLYDFIEEKDEFKRHCGLITDSKSTSFKYDGHLITRYNEKIPVGFFCSDVRDRSGEVVGIVLVAHDQRNTIRLKAALDEINETNRQLILARDALWGEMQLAKKIQTMLLPARPAIPGYVISAYMEPAEEVGGDYYDIINAKGKNWLVIGDVSGHGVPSGLIMMMVQTSIHVMLDKHPGIAPSELLESINATITKNIKQMSEDKYMTISVFAVLDDRHFLFSGLHQDIIVYRSEKDIVELIQTDGIWLGLKESIAGEVKDDSVTLKAGDSMFIYTDGITESWKTSSVPDLRDPESEMFGNMKLKDIFRKHAQGSPEEVKRAILSGLKDYDYNDDITMVIIKRDR